MYPIRDFDCASRGAASVKSIGHRWIRVKHKRNNITSFYMQRKCNNAVKYYGRQLERMFQKRYKNLMQQIYSIPKSVVGPARSFPNFSSRVFSWSCISNFIFLIGDGGLGACKISLCGGELGGGGESLPFVAFAETKKFSQFTDYATQLCRVDNDRQLRGNSEQAS